MEIVIELNRGNVADLLPLNLEFGGLGTAHLRIMELAVTA